MKEYWDFPGFPNRAVGRINGVAAFREFFYKTRAFRRDKNKVAVKVRRETKRGSNGESPAIIEMSDLQIFQPHSLCHVNYTRCAAGTCVVMAGKVSIHRLKLFYFAAIFGR